MAKKKRSIVSDIIPGDKEWRAESDARTLIEADEIRNDPERLKAARAYSKAIVQKHKGMVESTAMESLEDDDDGDE